MSEIEKTNKTCNIKDSEVCEFLGCDGCEKCVLNYPGTKDQERIKLVETWKVVQSNLPDDVDELHNSSTCLLCKKDHPNQTECYARVSFAHPDPPYERGAIFGMGKKVRKPVGSLIEIPIAVCKDCKRRHNIYELLTTVCTIAGVLIGAAVLFIMSGTGMFADANILYLLVALGGGAAIGYFAGKGFSNLYYKKNEERTEFELSRLPLVRDLMQRGWFLFNVNEGEKAKMQFSAKKPKENFRIKAKTREREDN